jgi:hypothetical protein
VSDDERPAVTAGEVVYIDERDYLYGVGRLSLRVTVVDPDGSYRPGAEWLQLTGVQLRRDGSDGPQRSVMVRVAALRKRRRSST